MATKKQSIRIANTDITMGDIFKIVPKPDLDAPSGFIQHGTSKLLVRGIKEIRSISFDERTRMWNTGFDTEDDCNKSLKREEKSALISLYNKIIKEPYEKKYKEDANNVNDDFWGGFSIDIFTNREFDTKNEKDMFELYHVLKQGYVCEEREKDATLQRSAMYCIKNIKKQQTQTEQKQEDKLEAMVTFSTLLGSVGDKKNEDDTLYTVLEWMNISNIRGADKETLKKTVLKRFEDEKSGNDNIKRFLEAFKMTKDKNSKDEMDLFSMLTKLNHAKKLEYRQKQYFLDGERLGNHLKEAAKIAATDSKIKDMVSQAYRNTIK